MCMMYRKIFNISNSRVCFQIHNIYIYILQVIVSNFSCQSILLQQALKCSVLICINATSVAWNTHLKLNIPVCANAMCDVHDIHLFTVMEPVLNMHDFDMYDKNCQIKDVEIYSDKFLCVLSNYLICWRHIALTRHILSFECVFQATSVDWNTDLKWNIPVDAWCYPSLWHQMYAPENDSHESIDEAVVGSTGWSRYWS